MKVEFKKIIPYVTAVAIFFVISIAYFSPSIFQNKTLHQNDVRKGYAAGIDLSEYQEKTGEKSLWASRMFSGMPAYQITPIYDNDSILSPVRKIFEGFLPSPAGHLFSYMLGFFILLIALRVNPWIAVVGAIAFAFSSYYLIIITAGHIWKVRVLQLIAPTLAGIIWTYRGKLLAGGVVTALFFALQLFCNHIQMTYYFFMFVGVFVVVRFIYDYKNKQLKRFAKATAILLFAGIIGFGANITNLIFTEKYTSQSTRGGSELAAEHNEKTAGLDLKYATDWSYGIGETFTFLIPNAKGGASGIIGQDGEIVNDIAAKFVKNPQRPTKLEQDVFEKIVYSNTYWGDQSYTAGPVYIGVLVLFLFIFGLFIVRGYLKWVLLIGAVFSILLSWGHNFMWFTELFFSYFPYYNKMRTVSSILVIAEFCIPVLATLALVKLVEKPAIVKESKKGFYTSIGLTAGLVFLFLVAPKIFFNFLSQNESVDFKALMAQGPEYSAAYGKAIDYIEGVRIAVFRADAWRSLFIILLGVGFIWLYSRKKIGKVAFVGAVGVIILFDMVLVDKRYLSNDNFVPKSQAKVMWEKTPADAIVLEDKDPNYRVLNLAVSTFNDGSTSYYHKSIGGYHGAKLGRYQELADYQLNNEMMRFIGELRQVQLVDELEDMPVFDSLPVLNMLNVRYVIFNEQQVPVKNSKTFGHAWFVENIKLVNNANEEMVSLAYDNLTSTAIVNKQFEQQLVGFASGKDSTANISLEKYEINDIVYKTSSGKEQLAVFSEIYYDDGLSKWDAFIDGQPIPVIRANYVLRALRIPAGEHTVEFVFKPKAYNRLEAISVACSVLILLASVGLIAFILIRKKKDDGNSAADDSDSLMV